MATAPVPYAARQKNWFERHLVWIICSAGVTFALLIVGGVCALFWSLGQSLPVQLSLAIVRTNARVIERIGEPIERGIVSGNVKTIGGGNADAELSFTVSGPKGSGTVDLVANSCARQWKFQTLEITFNGETNRTDLLKEASDTLSGASIICPSN